FKRLRLSARPRAGEGIQVVEFRQRGRLRLRTRVLLQKPHNQAVQAAALALGAPLQVEQGGPWTAEAARPWGAP
ncbi:MAG: hypothetical protein ACRETK_12050, partial [Steroidobacteraceae bacterium]